MGEGREDSECEGGLSGVEALVVWIFYLKALRLMSLTA